MAELVSVFMRDTKVQPGLHTAMKVDTSNGEVVVTIPASNGEVVVSLTSSDVNDLLNQLPGGPTGPIDPGQPGEIAIEAPTELDAVD